ncbi:MAG TPA: translocation/assembly module TamB domain-containing protein [Vicinamibacterales bacterium]
MRKVGRVLAIAGVAIVVIIALGVIAIETPWFKSWLKGFAVRQASTAINGQLSIGQVSGSIFTGIDLSNVALSQRGQPVLSARHIRVSYNPIDLATHGIDLKQITIDQPVIHLRQTPQGWNVTQLTNPSTSSGPASPVSINDLIINDGTIDIDERTAASGRVRLPQRVVHINADLGYHSAPDELMAAVHRFSAQAQQPSLTLASFTGTLHQDHGTISIEKVALETSRSRVQADGTVKQFQSGAPTYDLSLESRGVAFDELAPFVPALAGVHLNPTFSVHASGPARQVLATFDVNAQQAGHIDGRITADVTTPVRHAKGEIHLRNLNAAPVAGPSLASDITAQADFDLTIPANVEPHGSYSITAPHVVAAGYRVSGLAASGTLEGNRVTLDAQASAYGTQATVRGTLVRSPVLSYDLTGTFRGANLQALPGSLKLPDVRSDLNADLHVTGRGQAIKGDVTLATSHVAGATILTGTRASFDKDGTRLTYTATGRVNHLDLQRVARAFQITALAADRYRSDINSRFTVKGSGTSLSTTVVDASAALSRSALLGGHVPHFALQAHVQHGAVRAEMNGAFDGLDPSAIEPRPAYKGAVSGIVSLSAALPRLTGPIDPAAVTADGQLTLTDSSVGAFKLRSATLSARFAHAIGQIRQFAITGPDLNAKVTGQLSLDDTTPSNLRYHLDSPQLGALGSLVQTPVKGTVRVDGQVSGNRNDLHTQGNLSASNLVYGGNQVLSITSNFQVDVPNLQVVKGHYEAHADATFVKVAGQAINELALNATYQAQRLTFQTTAKQAPRQMQAAGVLVFYPHVAELQLRQLAMSTSGVEWRLAPEAQAVIRYGQGRTEIRALKLASGNQRMNVDGVIAPGGNDLTASLTNISLLDLEKLLLVDRHITGRLDASAHITGTARTPIVDAKLNVADGGFRNFSFQSAGGTARYTPSGIAVDLRLQENPAEWLLVQGTAPMSLFSPSTTRVASTAAAAPVNLTVKTSSIDLGVIQGFTTAIEKARGTIQADVHVGGTGADPAVSGYLALNDGGFAIPLAGTSYSALNVRINFVPDEVQITQFTISDDDHHALTVNGQLATQAKSVGAVNLNVNAKDFRVLDNDLGKIGLDTALQVTGKVMQPHIGGTLTVDEGRIDLAKLMEQVGSSPYSTHPLAAPDTEGKTTKAKKGQTPPRGTTPPATTDTNGMSVNVRIHVPDNFVIKGSDIRPAGSSFAVGDVNLTLGGDLHIVQPPGGELRLNGTINTVRGLYVFQGRRFQIARNGQIRFENLYPPNPALDITASRTIQGVEAQIHVGGTVSSPRLTLSSNPPLDEADILSLIVFNQPTNQLGEGQRTSLAERAQGLATSFVAGSLARSLGNALGVDMLQVQTAPEGGGGPEVTIGQQITSGLYVQVQQQVGAGSGTQFQLEYQFTNFMRLRTEANTGSQASQTLLHRVQQEGIDLIFFFSY